MSGSIPSDQPGSNALRKLEKLLEKVKETVQSR